MGEQTLSVLLIIMTCVGMWKTFEKLGEEGWKAIVPIYRDYVTFCLADMSGLNILWPAASVIAAILAFASVFGGIMSGIDSITASGWLLFVATFVIVLVAFIQTVRSYAHISRRLGHSGFFGILFAMFPYIMWMVAAFSGSWKPGTESRED